MTPAARIQTAIEILDRVLGGASAEQALTQWARASRFAGSGDRNAVRDHVFDALRRLRSYSAMGGGGRPSGRIVMLGALKAAAVDPDALFTGVGYGPMPLSAAETVAFADAPSLRSLARSIALDYPDWLEDALQRSLGETLLPVMQAMRHRAAVILRVHARRAERTAICADLARDGIVARPVNLAGHALEITENERKISQSSAYKAGLVELQDASPQAAVEDLPLRRGMRVLDYCAGGGGKSLAMAALIDGDFFAHDIAPARMRDLPERARRAEANIKQIATAMLETAAPFDLVLADVPCSGSGTWRRSPEAKWALTPERLVELQRIQAEILDTAAGHVTADGHLAYMTCSLLACENADQVRAFLHRNPDWSLVRERRYSPLEGGDGFYCALLTRQ